MSEGPAPAGVGPARAAASGAAEGEAESSARDASCLGDRDGAGLSDREALGLCQLQTLLESVNGVEAAPVAEFLVSAAERERLCPLSSPDEALLVARGDLQLGELRVGLFLSAEVLAQLGRGHREPWTARRLAGFCQAAEGVSHFLYLHHRAQASRPVSLLELEAQAELDKYLSVLLQLWASGRRAASTELRAALFGHWRPRAGLNAQERERYRLASVLASATAKVLEVRYVLAGRLEALLREVRRLYRLGGGEKLSSLAQGLAA